MEKVVPTVILGTFFILLIISFIAVFIVLYQRRHSRYLIEKQELQSQFEKALLKTQLEIQEQTLKNISQEIHDNIGQALTLAKLNINTMRCEEPAELELKIDNSRQLISKAIQDLRDLSRSLNTDYVKDLGLLRAIEYELEMIKKTGQIETLFHIEGNACRLKQQQELILFRIVQEILHNSLKHAKATVINVQAVFSPALFLLSVADNGIGFDTTPLAMGNYEGFGLGLRNMQNRAALINTNFTLTSAPGKGVKIELNLPMNT